MCCLGWLFPHFSRSPSLISSGSFCWHLSSREAFGAGPSGRQRVRRGDFGASGVLLGSESACSWSRGCTDGSGLGGARTERSGCQLRRAVAPKRRTPTSSLLFPGALGRWVCMKVAVGWAEPCPFSGTVSLLVLLKTPDEGAHFWSDVICLWCFQEGFS